MSRLLFFALMALITLPSLAQANWKKESRRILKENSYACKNSELRIEEIVSDSHISGIIKGLPQDAVANFKVLFYVKTNRWYAHPYFQPENPQEGLSYAKINQDGTFRIKTVKRAVTGSRLAVTVVPTPYVIKSQTRWLRPFLGLFGGVFRYSCRGLVVPLNGEL